MFGGVNSDNINWMVNQYTFMDNYDKQYYSLQIEDKLVSIKSSSIYVDDVIAYMPTINKKISAVTGVDNMTDSDIPFMKLSKKTFQIIFYKGQLYTNSVFVVGKKSPCYYSILVKFSQKALSNALTQFDNERSSITILSNSVGTPFLFSQKTALADQIGNNISSRLKAAYLSLKGTASIEINHKKYLLMYASSTYLGFTICNVIPEDVIFSPLHKYKIWFWLFSLATAGIIVVFSLSFYRIIQHPLKILIKAFKRVDGGEIDFTIKSKYNNEFSNLYEYFNIMLQSLRTLINQSYKQRIMLQDAELKQLQSQINPHFLYNSYFLLHRMIKGHDYDRAVIVSKYMGTYLKFVTRSALNEVSLEKEVEHAEIYTKIQAMRFEGRIAVEFGELPVNYVQFQVPRLILQPVIENAFEHGLKDKMENGLVRVSFEKFDYGLIIHVEDNGDELDDATIENLGKTLNDNDESVEKTAIINIHRRLQLMYGSESGLKISRSKIGGLRISIILRSADIQDGLPGEQSAERMKEE